MRNSKTKTMVYCALLAALYTALTIFLAPLSFGAMQIRISEALTVLAVFSPLSVIAVSIGCFLSNLVGFLMGQTLAVDMLVGPLATGLAAVASYLLRNVRIKKVPLLSALMPVLFNAVIIGAMITMFGKFTLPIFLTNAASVGIGELIACVLLGLPLVAALESRKLDVRLFGAVSKKAVA